MILEVTRCEGIKVMIETIPVAVPFAAACTSIPLGRPNRLFELVLSRCWVEPVGVFFLEKILIL
jgi:hypothetical protein